jgi:hypothetical protein
MRFGKSVKIAPGVRLNFSRSGVSTTIGGRGMSVNTGRRGTFVNAGIPGTGIHTRSRIGGRGGGSSHNAAGTGLAGCAGCGGIMVALLFFVIVIAGSSGGGGSTPPVSSYAPAPYSTGSSDAVQQRETVYAYGRVYVRTGPGASNAVARTLSRGDHVDVGLRDARGWAHAYDASGQAIGYVYLAGTRLRTTPPSGSSEPSRSSGRSSSHRSERSAPGGATAVCRDGSYSYSLHHRGTCSHHGGVAQWL